MGQFLKLIDDGVRELNSQFWLLHVAAGSASRRARTLGTLNGVAYRKLLDVAFPQVRERGRIRLRNQHCAGDLERLAKTSARWLPAYFVLLTKSLGESTVQALVEARIAGDATRGAQFAQYRRRNSRTRTLSKRRALQSLTQAVCRGDFDEFDRAFPLGVVRTQLNPLGRRLRLANRLRNRIAHELAHHISGTPGKSVAGWQTYTASMRRLVEILERFL